MEQNILEAGRPDRIRVPVSFSTRHLRSHDDRRIGSRLFLEYARVTSLDRDAMTYKDDAE